jgi:hypothetical protein
LDQHRNTPNPAGKKIVEYYYTKVRVLSSNLEIKKILSSNSEIEKVHKQDLQGKDNIDITMIRKNIRSKKVNSCMICTNKGYYGRTRGLCGPRIQHANGELNEKEYDHNKEYWFFFFFCTDK